MMTQIAGVVVRVGVVLALAPAVPLSADQVCGAHEGQRTALLRCRGGLAMGGHRTPPDADADLTLYFRSTRGDARRDELLDPGSCAWATRTMRSDEPRVVVFPMNGPRALDPYPIGHQAATCAADNACTMEFCAFDIDHQLRAVDGFIRLVFGGGQQRAIRMNMR